MGELGVESGFEGRPRGRPLLYQVAPFGLSERGFDFLQFLRTKLRVARLRGR